MNGVSEFAILYKQGVCALLQLCVVRPYAVPVVAAFDHAVAADDPFNPNWRQWAWASRAALGRRWPIGLPLQLLSHG
jgi:hypothetical protein